MTDQQVQLELVRARTIAFGRTPAEWRAHFHAVERLEAGFPEPQGLRSPVVTVGLRLDGDQHRIVFELIQLPKGLAALLPPLPAPDLGMPFSTAPSGPLPRSTNKSASTRIQVANGDSVSLRFAGITGTISVVPGTDGSGIALSCSHVLGANAPMVGATVQVQGAEHHPTQRHHVGSLRGYTALPDGGEAPVDLAVIEPDVPGVTWAPRWGASDGDVTGFGALARGAGDWRMFGWKNRPCLTHAIHHPRILVNVPYVGRVWLLDAFELTGPGAVVSYGDSGAGIRDERGRYAGMVVACSPAGSVIAVSWPAMAVAMRQYEGTLDGNIA